MARETPEARRERWARQYAKKRELPKHGHQYGPGLVCRCGMTWDEVNAERCPETKRVLVPAQLIYLGLDCPAEKPKRGNHPAFVPRTKRPPGEVEKELEAYRAQQWRRGSLGYSPDAAEGDRDQVDFLDAAGESGPLEA